MSERGLIKVTVLVGGEVYAVYECSGEWRGWGFYADDPPPKMKFTKKQSRKRIETIYEIEYGMLAGWYSRRDRTPYHVGKDQHVDLTLTQPMFTITH